MVVTWSATHCSVNSSEKSFKETPRFQLWTNKIQVNQTPRACVVARLTPTFAKALPRTCFEPWLPPRPTSSAATQSISTVPTARPCPTTKSPGRCVFTSPLPGRCVYDVYVDMLELGRAFRFYAALLDLISIIIFQMFYLCLFPQRLISPATRLSSSWRPM